MADIGKILVRFASDTSGVKRGVAESKKEISSFGKSVKKVATSIGGYMAAAFSVQVVANFVKEAIKLAGELEGVESAFNRLNNPTLLSNLREATRGTVTDLELMKQAVRADNFKVPLEKLASFFEFATKRSIQTGESVDYLVNSIIDGIGRKSTLVMDNLGISATELQGEIGRVGDFGVAAGNIIERELTKMGDVADTTSIKVSQLATEWKNFVADAGKELKPLGRAVASAGSLLIQSVRETMKEQRGLFWMFREANDIIEKNNKQYLAAQEAEKKAAKDANEAQKEKIVTIETLKLKLEDLEIQQLNASESELTAINQSIKAVNDKIKEYKNLGVEVDDITKKTRGLAEMTKMTSVTDTESIINRINELRTLIKVAEETNNITLAQGWIEQMNELNKSVEGAVKQFEKIPTVVKSIDDATSATSNLKVQFTQVAEEAKEADYILTTLTSNMIRDFDSIMEGSKSMADAFVGSMRRIIKAIIAAGVAKAVEGTLATFSWTGPGAIAMAAGVGAAAAALFDSMIPEFSSSNTTPSFAQSSSSSGIPNGSSSSYANNNNSTMKLAPVRIDNRYIYMAWEQENKARGRT
jgi:hypothetical protein